MLRIYTKREYNNKKNNEKIGKTEEAYERILKKSRDEKETDNGY